LKENVSAEGEKMKYKFNISMKEIDLKVEADNISEARTKVWELFLQKKRKQLYRINPYNYGGK